MKVEAVDRLAGVVGKLAEVVDNGIHGVVPDDIFGDDHGVHDDQTYLQRIQNPVQSQHYYWTTVWSR